MRSLSSSSPLQLSRTLTFAIIPARLFARVAMIFWTGLQCPAIEPLLCLVDALSEPIELRLEFLHPVGGTLLLIADCEELGLEP